MPVLGGPAASLLLILLPVVLTSFKDIVCGEKKLDHKVKIFPSPRQNLHCRCQNAIITSIFEFNRLERLFGGRQKLPEWKRGSELESKEGQLAKQTKLCLPD